MVSGIRGLGATAGTAAPTARKAAGGARFALPEETAASGPGTVLAAAPLSGLEAMLALQEAEASGARDREARHHGQELLRELARLQRALLAGGTDDALLGRLASLAETAPEAADPALRAMVAAVVLRAKVELARQGRGAR